MPLLPALFASLHVGVLSAAADGTVTAANPQAQVLLGYDESELLGRPVEEIVQPQRLDGTPLVPQQRPLHRVLRSRRPSEGEGLVVVRRDGTAMVLAWACAPILLAGELTGAVLAFHDVTARTAAETERAQQLERAREATARMAMLAEATTVLTGTLDVADALRRLAELVVPVLGDWSVVDLVEPPARVVRVAVAVAGGNATATTRPATGQLPDLDGDGGPLGKAVRGVRAVRVTDFPAPDAALDPLHAAQLTLYAELGATDAVVAPLRARGRTVGALTVVRTGASAPFGPADLDLVDDLTGRAALAVDNARLYTEQRRFAEQLQRALLPSLPAGLPGLQLAARYLPAGDVTQVGGDWYDAFALPDGSVALAVGDVAGHDLAAASGMGAIRHQLRALAADRRASPAEVLTRLDRVVQQFGTTEMTTAVYARILRQPVEPWSLSWAGAGHLPPVLTTGAGSRVLQGHRGLPLGVADLPREDESLAFPPGATLLLYTDGLVERPDRDIDAGLALLAQTCGPLAGLDVESFCEAVVAELAPAGRDDVALLAVRRLGARPPAPTSPPAVTLVRRA